MLVFGGDNNNYLYRIIKMRCSIARLEKSQTGTQRQPQRRSLPKIRMHRRKSLTSDSYPSARCSIASLLAFAKTVLLLYVVKSVKMRGG